MGPFGETEFSQISLQPLYFNGSDALLALDQASFATLSSQRPSVPCPPSHPGQGAFSSERVSGINARPRERREPGLCATDGEFRHGWSCPPTCRRRPRSLQPLRRSLLPFHVAEPAGAHSFFSSPCIWAGFGASWSQILLAYES